LSFRTWARQPSGWVLQRDLVVSGHQFGIVGRSGECGDDFASLGEGQQIGLDAVRFGPDVDGLDVAFDAAIRVLNTDNGDFDDAGAVVAFDHAPGTVNQRDGVSVVVAEVPVADLDGSHRERDARVRAAYVGTILGPHVMRGGERSARL
jgi:hypothetical protein